MDLEIDFDDEYENTESDFVPKHTDEPQPDVKYRKSRTSNRSGNRERQSFRSSKDSSDVFQGTGLRISASVETFNDEDFEGEDDLYIEGTLRLSFLDKFADLPNIDEISSESVETIIERQVEEKTIDITLTGKFVDPLTGLDLIESDKEDDEFDFVEIEESNEEQSYGDYEPFDITEDSDLLLLQPQEVFEEPEEGDNAVLDIDYIQKIMQAVDVQDIEQLLVDDTRLQNEEIVAGFIEDLFQLVDNAALYKDPKEILRKSVDKRKIMDEIHEKVRTLESEQVLRLYLNRKVVEHYKRKHMYRLIREDTAEDLEFLMAKYDTLLQKYNEILGKEEEIVRVTKTKVDKLHVKMEEKQFQVEEKISEFEALAYHIILPQRRDMYGGELDLKLLDITENVERSKFITVFLKRMALVRKELSEARLILIKKQHLFADLQQRLNKIQNIGDGLKLFQFENLQNDVIQLFKKNDERGTELAKARTRQQLDVHISTHLKESIQMLRNKLAIQKMTYRELLRQWQNARRNVYKQKQIRTQIRKEIKEYTFQGGILSKPTLMLDYDATVELIQKKQEIVEDLRSQYKKIVGEIAYYEEMLKRRSSNRYGREK